MQANRSLIILLIITAIIILLVIISIVVTILFLYQRKKITYQKEIDSLKDDYENNLLSTQLEIQEQTLQHISREIHDNIGLSLTLAKLNLNTLHNSGTNHTAQKITESAGLIGKAINDLSSISHSLNANVISNNGLIKALEEEALRISNIGTLKVGIVVSGNSIFLDDQKELLLFRIIQEALNNILKYSGASITRIELHFDSDKLHLRIKDNGCGFNINQRNRHMGSGLINMEARTKILNGSFSIESNNTGTIIDVIIPIRQ